VTSSSVPSGIVSQLETFREGDNDAAVTVALASLAELQQQQVTRDLAALRQNLAKRGSVMSNYVEPWRFCTLYTRTYSAFQARGLRTIDEDVQPQSLGSIRHGGRQEIEIRGNKSSVRQCSAKSSPPRRRRRRGSKERGRGDESPPPK